MELSADDGVNQILITGESTKETVKTIARGMPGVSGVTVVTNARVYYQHTRGCGRIGRPAFPAPSMSEGGIYRQTSGEQAARSSRHVCKRSMSERRYSVSEDRHLKLQRFSVCLHPGKRIIQGVNHRTEKPPRTVLARLIVRPVR